MKKSIMLWLLSLLLFVLTSCGAHSVDERTTDTGSQTTQGQDIENSTANVLSESQVLSGKVASAFAPRNTTFQDLGIFEICDIRDNKYGFGAAVAVVADSETLDKFKGEYDQTSESVSVDEYTKEYDAQWFESKELLIVALGSAHTYYDLQFSVSQMIKEGDSVELVLECEDEQGIGAATAESMWYVLIEVPCEEMEGVATVNVNLAEGEQLEVTCLEAVQTKGTWQESWTTQDSGNVLMNSELVTNQKELEKYFQVYGEKLNLYFVQKQAAEYDDQWFAEHSLILIGIQIEDDLAVYEVLVERLKQSAHSLELLLKCRGDGTVTNRTENVWHLLIEVPKVGNLSIDLSGYLSAEKYIPEE